MFLLSRPNMSWPKMKTKVPSAINQFRSPTVGCPKKVKSAQILNPEV